MRHRTKMKKAMAGQSLRRKELSAQSKPPTARKLTRHRARKAAGVMA
jgi:hypothetical protein